MDEVKKEESEMTSPAAFVEGGIQEACDDACSICLEAFCESDPSTVTSCKHEFHLQCVLEWCQRSSNCPMCWRPISLKDPISQELLEAVEHERSIRRDPSRNTPIYHHPTLVDFELQNLPVGVDGSELEERIMQHLAAATAIGRTHRIALREGPRTHSSARPRLMVLSANPSGSSTGPNPPSLGYAEVETETHSPATNIESQAIPYARQGLCTDNRSNNPNQDSPGPSELQSPSDNWKSRFSSLSMKYKESISRNTRGWKEKLFSRSTSMAEIGSQVKRELNAGIATVSRMVERLETRENRAAVNAPSENSAANSSTSDSMETSREAQLDGNRPPNFAPSSVSS